MFYIIGGIGMKRKIDRERERQVGWEFTDIFPSIILVKLQLEFVLSFHLSIDKCYFCNYCCVSAGFVFIITPAQRHTCIHIHTLSVYLSPTMDTHWRANCM